MTSIIKKYKSLSLKMKIQLITALLLTLAIIVSIPTLAWFNHQRQIAELQRIKSPDLLYISAAAGEDVKYFDISTIKVSDKEGAPTSQMFPFAVAGEYVTSFTLQFAHTTNSPFVYKIYYGIILDYIPEGEEEKEICKTAPTARTALTAYNAEHGTSFVFENDVIEYKVKAAWSEIEDFDRDSNYDLAAGDTIYILKGECIKDGTAADYLNAQTVDGRIIATNKYHSETYDTYSSTYVNKYAEPLYWQKSEIPSVPDSSAWGSHPFFKTFILEVSWDPDEMISRNKETDMLYISAYRDQ